MESRQSSPRSQKFTPTATSRRVVATSPKSEQKHDDIRIINCYQVNWLITTWREEKQNAIDNLFVLKNFWKRIVMISTRKKNIPPHNVYDYSVNIEIYATLIVDATVYHTII